MGVQSIHSGIGQGSRTSDEENDGAPEVELIGPVDSFVLTPATGGTKLTQTDDKKVKSFLSIRSLRAPTDSDEDEGGDGGDADEISETFRPRYTPANQSTRGGTSPSPPVKSKP